MQQKEITNPLELTDLSTVPAEGRIVSLDPGTKRVGVAVCDELRFTTRPLPFITRTSWKKLLVEVKTILAELDAKALVIGLPLRSDGGESEMSSEARSMARRFSLSLEIPVYLQDERVTSYEAKSRLWQRGLDVKESRSQVDSEAAAIILSDFLDRL
ncbi:MAG: Holliday junction resolvase RuvX [Pyrinomonadaceae bacterium]|nr:Holliday junction resolvase RuvX [Acidobacteriota bacterium]MBK7935366.1 Holliday junction resolvase RuvX [Acidobacteriota bacterium]MBP7376559.1 Holliday junction resolvase RuvX [Pyrinomonadaceae bacterium]